MKRRLINTLLILPFIVFTSCVITNDNTINIPQSRTYQLGAPNGTSVGTVAISENEDNTLTVAIQLSNTIPGEMHPAHFHMNSAVEGGAVVITLNDVNGSTGLSTTIVSSFDGGSSVNFNQLAGYDGHLNVHLSASDLQTLVAQGDIGQNELTGSIRVYPLDEVDVPGISGSITFYERFSGESLALIQLSNTTPGESHPAHIHMNDVNEGGPAVLTFNPVDGTSGFSLTHVARLDNTSSFGYQDVLVFNGHVNVHISTSDLMTLVAQGNIGSNALQ